MKEELFVEGVLRSSGRKGPARRLRKEGKVPGVIYGQGDDLVIAVNERDIKKVLDTPNQFLSVITTKIEGDSKARTVMIKELDFHPLDDRLIHIDLIEIDLSKLIKAKLDVVLNGVAKGVKDQGGSISLLQKKIEVEFLPKNIIPDIKIDITPLELGDVLKVSDLSLGKDVKILSNPDDIIVIVNYPKVEETKPEEGDESSAAPESSDTADAKP
ncbi:MAG: 50S ribosomal protein L25 [Nitrospinota bacterium]